MALACTAARYGMYAKASFDARDRHGQSVLRHIAPLAPFANRPFQPVTWPIQLLERMF